MDIWYQHAFPGAKHSLVKWELKSHDVFKQAALHAEQNTSKRLLPHVAQQKTNGRLALRRRSTDTDTGRGQDGRRR